MRSNLLVVFAFALSSCSGQKKLDVNLIFDSNVKNNVILSIKKKDPLFFSNKYHWLVYQNLNLCGLEMYGLKYSYNYDDSILREVNGIFTSEKKIGDKGDIAAKTEFNFYFDKDVVGWFTASKDRNIEVIRAVDIEKGTQQETTFQIPKSLQDTDPIIIDTNKLLYNNLILKSDNTIDTLLLDKDKDFWFPHYDRVFMRKNSFMVDRYHGQENPVLRKDVNPIDYFKIEGNRLVVQNINPPNAKIANYRVEANHENIWFMSHKISPEKFLLYDVKTDKAYPFELDKSIFKLENLRLIELPEPDPLDPYDVRFSYRTSMTESNLYIYIINNGIKLYKVSDYRKLLR
jgi:hypothetical protein